EVPVLPVYSDLQQRQLTELEVRVSVLQAILGGFNDGLIQTHVVPAEADIALNGPKPETTVPICRELSDQRRVTQLQYRGNYLDKGPVVEPGLPTAFHAATGAGSLDRLKLARWLVDKNNPLTARVVA